MYDWDRVGDHDLLGSVEVAAADLLHPPRTRLDLALAPPPDAPDAPGSDAGTLTVEIRPFDDEVPSAPFVHSLGIT